MDSSEKIINNYDVLQLLFRYLDFEDHLKLIKICPQFAYAIVHGVWRWNCNNFYISQSKFGYSYCLQYKAENNVMTERLLTLKAIHIILQHTSMYIHKLEMNSVRCLGNIISLKYHHLTELAFCDIFVEDTHLQQVAENCLNLQSFTLKNFTNSKDESNIRVNVFGEMKALNTLLISDTKFTAWNYFEVHQLFCLPHLKTLIIDIEINDKNYKLYKGNSKNSGNRACNIENVTIADLRALLSRNLCFIKVVRRFENLTKLTISPMTNLFLNDTDLKQINNACPKLRELSFVGCYFKFKKFPRMNNLLHLIFDSCYDMKFKHFDEIFRKLKLKSLSLMGVRHMNEEEEISDYNYISNTLETFTMERIYGRTILRTFFNQLHKFENVSKVWLESYGYVCKLQLTELCFSHNFPNLQELIMDSFYISSEDILNLKHLKVLQFNVFYGMSWSYLEILLKHPTLTHITITPIDSQNFGMDYNRLPECWEGLTTTMEYLSLPSIVYKMGLNFWASFRKRNKQLKLEIVDCDTLKRRAAPL